MKNPFTTDALDNYKHSSDFKCLRQQESKEISWRHTEETFLFSNTPRPAQRKPTFTALFVGHFHQTHFHQVYKATLAYFSSLSLIVHNHVVQRDHFGSYVILSVQTNQLHLIPLDTTHIINNEQIVATFPI